MINFTTELPMCTFYCIRLNRGTANNDRLGKEGSIGDRIKLFFGYTIDLFNLNQESNQWEARRKFLIYMYNSQPFSHIINKLTKDFAFDTAGKNCLFTQYLYLNTTVVNSLKVILWCDETRIILTRQTRQKLETHEIGYVKCLACQCFIDESKK